MQRRASDKAHSSPLPRRCFTSLTRSCQPGNPYSRASTSWASRCDNGSLALGRWARAWSMAPGSPAAMPRASFLACLRRDSSEGRAGSFDVVITPPFKSACDPLIQAERRCKARCLDQSRWDLFPCRGSVVPCRTLPLVSATCRGTVKPRFHGPFLAVYSRTLEIAAGSRATLP